MVWGEEEKVCFPEPLLSVRMERVEVSEGQVSFCGSSWRYLVTYLTILLLHVRRTDHALR